MFFMGPDMNEVTEARALSKRAPVSSHSQALLRTSTWFRGTLGDLKMIPLNESPIRTITTSDQSPEPRTGARPPCGWPGLLSLIGLGEAGGD